MGDRRLHRRFGTRRLWQSRGPGRYVALTPLGVPVTRDGRPVAIERRPADHTEARPAGWYTLGPPDWAPTYAGHLAREAAQTLHKALQDHDRAHPGLARP